jgi:hypothetical protein
MAHALFARGDPTFDTVESAQWQAAQVSITSIANCLGRIIFGTNFHILVLICLAQFPPIPRDCCRSWQTSLRVAEILLYRLHLLHIHRLTDRAIQRQQCAYTMDSLGLVGSRIRGHVRVIPNDHDRVVWTGSVPPI